MIGTGGMRVRRKIQGDTPMTTITAAKPFDAAKYKETTREQWQAAANAWNNWGPLLSAWLGPATEIMLDMANVGRGHRVLDVAAGAGDQTLQAAERVGPNGHVLATDISSNILAFAAENASRAGHRNVETKVLDGEDLDVPEGTFDAVISRVGLIYFPDQQKALAGMKRALKPGGRVAAIVYGTAENNRFFSIPVAMIRRRADLPPPLPGQPGPFSLGGAGVLEEALPQGRLPRRREQDRAGAGANDVRGRVRALRAGVVRRPAPDARRPRRGRTRGGVAGDRAGARGLRRDGRVRGPLRDGRRRRGQVSARSQNEEIAMPQETHVPCAVCPGRLPARFAMDFKRGGNPWRTDDDAQMHQSFGSDRDRCTLLHSPGHKFRARTIAVRDTGRHAWNRHAGA